MGLHPRDEYESEEDVDDRDEYENEEYVDGYNFEPDFTLDDSDGVDDDNGSNEDMDIEELPPNDLVYSPFDFLPTQPQPRAASPFRRTPSPDFLSPEEIDPFQLAPLHEADVFESWMRCKGYEPDWEKVVRAIIDRLDEPAEQSLQAALSNPMQSRVEERHETCLLANDNKYYTPALHLAYGSEQRRQDAKLFWVTRAIRAAQMSHFNPADPFVFDPRPEEEVTDDEIKHHIKVWCQGIPDGERSEYGNELYWIAVRLESLLAELPHAAHHGRLLRLDIRVRDALCGLLAQLKLYAFYTPEDQSMETLEFGNMIYRRLNRDPMDISAPLHNILLLTRDFRVAVSDYWEDDYCLVSALHQLAWRRPILEYNGPQYREHWRGGLHTLSRMPYLY